MKPVINNHLKKGYSNYLLMFLKKHHPDLSLDDAILDVGTGHMRNLIFLQQFGFHQFAAVDLKTPDPVDPEVLKKCKFSVCDIQEGLPYPDNSFKVVLCNFVLMFIDPEKLPFVVNELIRVSSGFLIIETNKAKYKTYTHLKEYDFQIIKNLISDNPAMSVVNCRNYYEKLTAFKITEHSQEDIQWQGEENQPMLKRSPIET